MSKLRTRDPAVIVFHIASFDGGPGDAMRGLLLPRIAFMCAVGVVEGGAKYILRVLRQMSLQAPWQIGVACVWHAKDLPHFLSISLSKIKQMRNERVY